MKDFSHFDQDYYISMSRAQRLRVRRLNKTRLFVRLFLIIALIGALSFSAYNYGDTAIAFLSDKVKGTFADPNTSSFPAITGGSEKQKDNQRNILILGVDQRKNEPSRSDTIIVLMLNPETKRAHFISLPRDSRVEIEGYKYMTKLNHAHANGGMDLAENTIEKLMGIEIHNTLETNFTGFENIIDLLGGVELEVEGRMYYPAEDIDVKEGWQVLDGHKALGYVRYRSDGRGDLGRIERQQKFLKALIEQHLSLDTLTKIPEIIGEIKDNIETDLSVAELMSLTKSFRSMESANVRFHQLPGEADYIKGGSYYVVDGEELYYLVREINADLQKQE